MGTLYLDVFGWLDKLEHGQTPWAPFGKGFQQSDIMRNFAADVQAGLGVGGSHDNSEPDHMNSCSDVEKPDSPSRRPIASYLPACFAGVVALDTVEPSGGVSAQQTHTVQP